MKLEVLKREFDREYRLWSQKLAQSLIEYSKIYKVIIIIIISPLLNVIILLEILHVKTNLQYINTIQYP